MSAPISDETNFHHKNSANRLRQTPTGAGVTSTKVSKPIYSYIKDFFTENGNCTYVTDTNETMMHTGSTFSHKCSLDSSVEDITELDRLIEFHANASRRDNCDYDSTKIPLNSSFLSETFSNISWLDPKSPSEKFASHEGVKNYSKRGTKSDTIKHISEDLVADNEIRIDIHETPKVAHLKPFERGGKQKPLRLANLPRRTYTRGKNEVRITKEDIKLVEPNSDKEMLDIKKHLAKARRKLTFSLEDSFKTSSTSFTSIKSQEVPNKNSSISITSSKPQDHIKSSRSFLSSMKQEDSGFITSSEKQEDFNVKSDLRDASDLEKQTVTKDNEYFRQNAKVLEESGGTFLLENYLAKLKGIAEKPPTTKRAKAFEQRSTSRIYFDFDDYCMKIFSLKEKFVDKQNNNKTV